MAGRYPRPAISQRGDFCYPRHLSTMIMHGHFTSYSHLENFDLSAYTMITIAMNPQLQSCG